jgi:hypothetical protein
LPSEAAGYSGTPLARKLGVTAGAAVALVDAPDWLAGVIGEQAGAGMVDAGLAGGTRYDVIVAFVAWRAELAAGLPGLRAALAPAGGLWIAWPKRAARMPGDMTDQAVRDVARPTGLVDNKVCAIDQTWSGLRLVIRRELRAAAAR